MHTLFQFHNQQLEKLRKANQEVVDLKEFQQSQMSEMKARKQAEKDDLYSCDEKDQTMMKVIVMGATFALGVKFVLYFSLKRLSSNNMQIKLFMKLKQEVAYCNH